MSRTRAAPCNIGSARAGRPIYLCGTDGGKTRSSPATKLQSPVFELRMVPLRLTPGKSFCRTARRSLAGRRTTRQAVRTPAGRMNRHIMKRNNTPAVYGPSRRDLVKTLLAAGAGAAFPFGASLAQVSSAQRPKAGSIDVHHHMTAPAYVKAMEKEMAATGFNPRQWTPGG